MPTLAELLTIFNGTYTIQNRAEGTHRTFRIRTQKPDASFAPGKRVLALMTGSDNEHSYTGFAFVENDGIRVWSSKRGHGDWEAYAKLVWSLATDSGFSEYADRYSLLVSGTCVKCNRKLTTPESIKTGIGPVCDGREAKGNEGDFAPEEE
jgi:hypothetical protein